MDTREAIAFLDKRVPNPGSGLPQDVFCFISRMTPMVNVDLLVKDESGRTLLAWRDDKFSGKGWHVPGGIVRYKERFETRARLVSEKEIGVVVEFDPSPMAINQIHCPHKTRGHFISILYKCFLAKDFIPLNSGLSDKDQGFLMWHNSCPPNLIKVHEIYRKYI